MGIVVGDAASEGEAAACLALMPQVGDLVCDMLVARCGDRVVGAAAIAWKSWSSPPGFPLWLHVLPASRRQGVGRRLLAAVRDKVRGEACGLWSMRPQAPDSDGAIFLSACGFEPRRRQHFFEADVGAITAVTEPLLRRWEDRGETSGIRCCGLEEAPLQELGWLVSAEFGGGPLGALQRLQHRAGPGGGDPDDRSLVVMQDAQPAGVMLCRRVDGRYVVEGRVVAPAWRNRWPNMVLLARTARRAHEEGVARFRFHCDSDVYDTLKLARRCAADETEIRLLHYAAVAAV